jgi:hypothetical protein
MIMLTSVCSISLPSFLSSFLPYIPSEGSNFTSFHIAQPRKTVSLGVSLPSQADENIKASYLWYSIEIFQ